LGFRRLLNTPKWESEHLIGDCRFKVKGEVSTSRRAWLEIGIKGEGEKNFKPWRKFNCHLVEIEDMYNKGKLSGRVVRKRVIPKSYRVKGILFRDGKEYAIEQDVHGLPNADWAYSEVLVGLQQKYKGMVDFRWSSIKRIGGASGRKLKGDLRNVYDAFKRNRLRNQQIEREEKEYHDRYLAEHEANRSRWHWRAEQAYNRAIADGATHREALNRSANEMLAGKRKKRRLRGMHTTYE